MLTVFQRNVCTMNVWSCNRHYYEMNEKKILFYQQLFILESSLRKGCSPCLHKSISFGISTIHWNCVSRKSSVLLTTHVSSLKVSEQYNYHKHRRLIGSYSIKWKKNKSKLSDTFGCLKNLLENNLKHWKVLVSSETSVYSKAEFMISLISATKSLLVQLWNELTPCMKPVKSANEFLSA